MCGICGVVEAPDGGRAVRQMAAAMRHRGPDSDGFLDAAPIHLGMRRLRIIDLEGGDQPIFNEDRSVAVIFNGEIYNFRELRAELEALGHRFVSCSDTEVIVHGYEAWGIDLLPRLRGMFAIAIYDGRPQGDSEARLLLARDRLGIKPLYLYQPAGGGLLFASEVRALLASGCVPRAISPEGLYTFLAFGSVQEPLTMVAGVFSLPPASWLMMEVRRDELHQQQGVYWQPPIGVRTSVEPEEVRSWLADAVESHLVSDVPLGAFLSGGLDSGTIVAFGSMALPHPLRTFTMAFDSWPRDERVLAEATARRWQTEHQTRVVHGAEVLADLPAALEAMDQPTVDGINSWYVSREARRAGLTVALSGVGGDELFAGYPSFQWVPRLERLPVPQRWLGSLAQRALSWASLSVNSDSQRKLLAYAAGDLVVNHPYFAVRALFVQSQVERLLTAQALERLQSSDSALKHWRQVVQDILQQGGRYDSVNEVSWLEITQYMRSTLLRDTDFMSMAHSLEVRVPFVDHVLLEQVLPLGGHLKLNGQPKRLLRQALEGLLPPEVLTHSKHTFTFPFERWLRRELAPAVEAMVLNMLPLVSEWFEPTEVLRVWRDFESGRTNWARPWALYIALTWLRRHLL